MRRFRLVFLRAFLRAPSGIAGLLALSAIAFVYLFGPALFNERATTEDFLHLRADPSRAHPFGTDDLGRDIFAQVLVATRLSLTYAIGAAALAFILGVTLGCLAALTRGHPRRFLLRAIDTMLSFPALLTAIFVTVIIGRGGIGAMVGIGIAYSFSLARVTSTLALSVAGRDYIQAARILGVPRHRLFRKHLLPGTAEPLIIASSVVVTASILEVSALSFLGLGVQPPRFDWGALMVTGIKSIYLNPAAALGPAAAIAFCAIAFSFTGEAIARAMNPRLWTTGRQPRRRRSSTAAPEMPATPRAGSVARSESAPRPDALEVEDLVVSFPGSDGPVDVVKGISFAVQRSEVIGIVGESGSGKSMTALAIAQLIPYPGRISGAVRMFGTELQGLSRRELDRFLGTRLAFVFQDPMSSLNPALRIGTQLTQAVRRHQRVGRRAARRRAADALTEVHIPTAEQQLSRFPHEFSGGMRQRAMIAMGLIKDPKLLIADEPTTALDVTIQAQVMELLDEVNDRHQTAVILISHNLALVSQNCDRVLVMYAGRIVEELAADQLASNALHPYTRALVATVPDLSRLGNSDLVPIPGEVPDIAAPPAGCAFHPRCPLKIDRCERDIPELVRRTGGRRVACHVANSELDAGRAPNPTAEGATPGEPLLAETGQVKAREMRRGARQGSMGTE